MLWISYFTIVNQRGVINVVYYHGGQNGSLTYFNGHCYIRQKHVCTILEGGTGHYNGMIPYHISENVLLPCECYKSVDYDVWQKCSLQSLAKCVTVKSVLGTKGHNHVSDGHKGSLSSQYWAQRAIIMSVMGTKGHCQVSTWRKGP